MKTLSLSTETVEAVQVNDLQQKLRELETRNTEIEQSIRYAGNLQQSILPHERIFQNVFSDAFVMFRPKDTVSGDFYWIYQHNNDVYFAVADCTGHGIPGALLNIAGNAILRQIIRIDGMSQPNEIIELLDVELSNLFNDYKTVGETNDGMDIVLGKINQSTGMAQFCNAGRPLIIVRGGEIIELSKGAYAVGYSSLFQKEFTSQDVQLLKGDQLYLFTDGYTDQFGGDNVKKFNRSRFRKMLCALSNYPMEQQKKVLNLSFDNWKGTQEQIDDVCVVGIKV